MLTHRFYDPFADPRTLMNDVWRQFDSFFGREPVAFPFGSARGPRFYVERTEDGIRLTAEVPGLRPEALKLSVEGRKLRVSGERDDQVPEGYQVRRTERPAIRFERVFELPEDIDGQAAAARLKDGILTLTMPKRPEAQPRVIEVEAS